MEQLTLHPHPDSGVAAARRIEAEIGLSAIGRMTIRFVVMGEIKAISLPKRAAPARRDGLWRNTCFEAFLRAPTAHGYCEFNFSPSTEWAAYRFSAYRENMAPLDIPAPSIATKFAARRYAVEASLDIAGLPRQSAWKIGLSAIIAEANGDKTYWALAHPPGGPDFHHRDSFAHMLNRENFA